MFIGEFIKTHLRKWGKQDWAEEKLNRNVGDTEASVNPVRCAGADQALLSYAKSRQRGQGFVALPWVWTGPGEKRWNTAQENFLWPGQDFSTAAPLHFGPDNSSLRGRAVLCITEWLTTFVASTRSILLLTTGQSKYLQTVPMSLGAYVLPVQSLWAEGIYTRNAAVRPWGSTPPESGGTVGSWRRQHSLHAPC